MARIRPVKTNFTNGEVDPLITMRSDLEMFVNGASLIRNALPFPQGGFRRRDGLETMTIIPVAPHPKPLSLTAPTVAAPGSGYGVGDVLTASGGTLSVAGGGTSTGLVIRVISTSGSGVAELEVISIGDYSVVPSAPAATTTDGGGTGCTLNWTEETQEMVKLIEFGFSLTQNYIVVFTVGRWYVFRKEDTGSGPNQLVETQHNSPYSNQQLKEITVTQSLDVMVIFSKDLPMRKLIRTSEVVWTFEEFFPANPPTFAFGSLQTAELTVPFPDGTVVNSNVNVVASTNTFADTDVGKYIRVIAGTDANGQNFSSYLRLTNFVGATIMKADFLALPILNTGASPTLEYKVGGANWLLEEVEFSHEHGYPRCGVFYQGRLVTAATIDRPQTMFTSRSGDINDFNSGITSDDFGIVATAESGTQSTIQNIHAGRHLQLFADNAEYYIPISEIDPITPTNVALRRTSSVGSIASVPVFDVDGTVYFNQRGGESFREFSFVDGVKAYESNIVSLFSSHLIRNPSDAAFKKSLNTEFGNYIWVVNEDDFSLAAFSVLKSELINAWSLQTTEGKFKGVMVSDQDTYFHVTRNPGGTINYSGFFTDLEGATGTGNSNPQGVAYTHDGKKMFVLSNQTDLVYEYALNFDFSLQRVVFTGNTFDVSSFVDNPKEIVISPDGLKMFIMDLDNDDIHEFDMAEPNSLEDGNVTDSGFTLDYNSVAPTGTGFDIIGKNVFIVGSGADKVFLFTLTNDYTFEGGTSYSGKSFDVSTQAGNPQDVKLSADGFRFFVVDGTTEMLYQYVMTTAFDPSTASYTGDSFDTGPQDGNPFGMSFSADGKTLLICGTETDSVYQYNLSQPYQFGTETDWIEFFQKNLKFDAAECKFSGITTPVLGITGADQLINTSVGIIIDDVIYENQTVAADGSLTFPIAANYNYQVGLPFPNIIVKDENNEDVDTGFNVLVKTLPADVLLQEGTTMGKKKRVPRCTVRFFETQGFYLQGNLVPFRNLPEVLDRPIPLQTGEKELTGLLGFDNFGQITIAQREPLAMTVLGLGYDLSTGT